MERRSEDVEMKPSNDPASHQGEDDNTLRRLEVSRKLPDHQDTPTSVLHSCHASPDTILLSPQPSINNNMDAPGSAKGAFAPIKRKAAHKHLRIKTNDVSRTASRTSSVRDETSRTKPENNGGNTPRKRVSSIASTPTLMPDGVSRLSRTVGADRAKNTSKSPSPPKQHDNTRPNSTKSVHHNNSKIPLRPMPHVAEQLSQTRLIEAIAGRLEKNEVAISRLTSTMDEIDGRLPTKQQSLARHAISSLKRVVAGHQAKSNARSKLVRRRTSARESIGSSKDKPTRIPRPVALSAMLPSSPAVTNQHGGKALPPSPPGNALFYYNECKIHERYAKSWTIAANHAADRAGEHQRLAATALRAFGQLMDDVLKDPEIKARTEEIMQEKAEQNAVTNGK